jgi:hypothetical protein
MKRIPSVLISFARSLASGVTLKYPGSQKAAKGHDNEKTRIRQKSFLALIVLPPVWKPPPEPRLRLSHLLATGMAEKEQNYLAYH